MSGAGLKEPGEGFLARLAYPTTERLAEATQLVERRRQPLRPVTPTGGASRITIRTLDHRSSMPSSHAALGRKRHHAATAPLFKPHEIEHRVSHRIKHQEILHLDQPPPYTAIIHEAALRMRFGDRSTDHGTELIDSPAQLERYRLILNRTTQAALPPTKSRDFISQLIQDL